MDIKNKILIRRIILFSFKFYYNTCVSLVAHWHIARSSPLPSPTTTPSVGPLWRHCLT